MFGRKQKKINKTQVEINKIQIKINASNNDFKEAMVKFMKLADDRFSKLEEDKND